MTPEGKLNNCNCNLDDHPPPINQGMATKKMPAMSTCKPRLILEDEATCPCEKTMWQIETWGDLPSPKKV
jgi:hypothetical protein